MKQKKAVSTALGGVVLALLVAGNLACSGGGGGGGGGGCSDQCSPSGARQCSGDGYRVCGNYDSDKCLEWSTVTACKTGETCSDGACVPAPPPTIQFSPSSLTFVAQVGQTDQASLNISNRGGGTLGYSLSDDAAWLTLSPTSGTATTETDPITVTASCVGLVAGDYSATITIADPAATNNPQTLSVSLTCNPPPPTIAFSPPSLSFTAKAGQAAADQTLNLSNSGSGAVSYTISDDADWLGENPTTGSVTTGTDPITVSATCAGLAANTYHGTLTITDPGAANNPQTFPVSLACTIWKKIGSDARVTHSAGNSWYPSLAWTGSEYGVGWDDDVDSPDREIYFQRLTAVGALAGEPTRVTNAAGVSEYPSLVWAGSEFGIAWEDDRDGNFEIYFARLSAQGAVLGSEVRVSQAAGDSWNPSLAWTGSEYGVSWEDPRDGNYEIYFARVSAAGAAIGSETRVTNAAGVSAYPSLVWTGSEYGAAFEDNRDGNFEIYLGRISAAGAPVGETRVTQAAGESESPSLVWAGSEFGASWQDFRDGNYEIYFARLSAAGALLGSELRLTSNAGASQNPSLVWTGSEFGVIWNDAADNPDGEIYLLRLDGTGALIGGPVRVTNNAGFKIYPALAWSGSEYGVCWQDYRDGDYELYFARIGWAP